MKWKGVVSPHSMTWQLYSDGKRKKKKTLLQNKFYLLPWRQYMSHSPQKLHLVQQFLMALSLSYLLALPAKPSVCSSYFQISSVFFLPSWKPWPLKASFWSLCLVFFWLLLWINLILEELIQEGKAKAVWNMCQGKRLFMTWITAFSICLFGRLKLYLKYERCRKKQECHIHPQNIHFCFYNSINSSDFSGLKGGKVRYLIRLSERS